MCWVGVDQFMARLLSSGPLEHESVVPWPFYVGSRGSML